MRSRLQVTFGVGLIALASCSGAALGQPICGNGIVEPGEQCDVAATASGLDECDGCAIDCTATEECGGAACIDAIDNDGDGLIDTTDPSCATFAELQSLAVVANDRGQRALHLRRGARVAPVAGLVTVANAPYPLNASEAGVCGTQVTIDGPSTLGGSVVSTGPLRFQLTQPAGVADRIVTTRPDLLEIHPQAPFVGAPTGHCSQALRTCLSQLDCGPKEECLGRALLTPASPWVDLTGMGTGAADLGACRRGLSALSTLIDGISKPATGARLRLELAGGRKRQTLSVKPGLNELTFESVHIGADAVLQIDGPADAIVVIHVTGAMRLLARARVEVGGGIEPRNILWNVVNPQPREVAIGDSASLVGTILAPKRGVRLRRGSNLRGAIYADNVTLQPLSRVEHIPFSAMLPTTLTVSVSAATHPNAQTRIVHVDVRNPEFSWAAASTVRVPLAAGESFVDATPSQGHCLHDGSATGGVVTCFLGAIPGARDGVAGTATIDVTIYP